MRVEPRQSLLEDVPWRSTETTSREGYETEYYGLLATAVIIESLAGDSSREQTRAVGRVLRDIDSLAVARDDVRQNG